MSTNTNKKNRSRAVAAKSSAIRSSVLEVNQKVEPYQTGKVRPKRHDLTRFKRPVLETGMESFSLIDLLVTHDTEVVYAATKNMSQDDKKATVSYLRDVADQLAQKIGMVEPEVSIQTQQENKRFINNLKNESKSTREEHIAIKKLLSSSAFQQRLGISKQAISKAIKENRMFAVLGPSGENFYPAFFAEEKYDRRQLEKVCKALGALPGGSKWQFFTTPKGSLDGRTPLDALAVGDIQAVMMSAAGFVGR